MDIIELYAELSVIASKFLENIKKEPRERRERADRINKFLNEFVKLEYKFDKLNKNVKSEPSSLETLSTYQTIIENSLSESRKLLQERSKLIEDKVYTVGSR